MSASIYPQINPGGQICSGSCCSPNLDMSIYASNMPANSRIRSACDACHKMKVRCSGEVPCETCVTSGSLCFYSHTGPLGRPKGTPSNRSRPSRRRLSIQSHAHSERQSQLNTAEILSPPPSASSSSAHKRHSSRQVQSTAPIPPSSAVAEERDREPGVTPMEPTEYDGAFEFDTFGAEFGDPQSQGPVGQTWDFPNFFTSEGNDHTILGQIPQVNQPSTLIGFHYAFNQFRSRTSTELGLLPL